MLRQGRVKQVSLIYKEYSFSFSFTGGTKLAIEEEFLDRATTAVCFSEMQVHFPRPAGASGPKDSTVRSCVFWNLKFSRQK
jgi:hypothetical protein